MSSLSHWKTHDYAQLKSRLIRDLLEKIVRPNTSKSAFFHVQTSVEAALNFYIQKYNATCPNIIIACTAAKFVQFKAKDDFIRNIMIQNIK
jgi:hypothetical protein